MQKFENQLRFDKVTECLKVGTFSETQCSKLIITSSWINHNRNLFVSKEWAVKNHLGRTLKYNTE